MSTDTQAYPETQAVSVVAPTVAQLERRARLRRFNRLTIYLPMTLIGILWLGLIVGLLWLTVVGDWFAMDTNQAYYRNLISGVADGFTILMLLPVLLLCAVPSALLMGLLVYRRQRAGDRGKEAQLPIFWRLENTLVTVQQQIGVFLPKLSRPVIAGHALVSFVETFLLDLKRIITREKKQHVSE